MSLLRDLQVRLRTRAVPMISRQPLPELDPTSLPKFSPSIISDLVFTSDDVPEESRVNDRYIHVSQLIDFCARRHVISILDQINLLKQPRGQDRVVWAMGRAAEHHVRTQIIQRLNYTGVVGLWECRCGRLTYMGVHDKNRRCSRCTETATVYKEFEARDDEYRILGHPDFLFFNDQQLTVLEIKSMKKESTKTSIGFEDLNAPLPNHILQAGAYRRIMEHRRTVDVMPTVIIFYVAKDYIFKGTPYKEYHVDVTEPAWSGILDLAWRNAAAARDALDNGVLPLRLTACPNHNTTMARNCPACVGCFARSS